MEYQLIALDLDGTLLNSRKELPQDAVRAIREVCAAGKTVVFDTGRAVPELAEQIALLPKPSASGLSLLPRQSGFSLFPGQRTLCPSWCWLTGM